MALRAAKGDEDALGQRGARAHACRLDTRVEAWLLRLTNRVFNRAVAWAFRIIRILHAALP
jgi:hypothetical protein